MRERERFEEFRGKLARLETMGMLHDLLDKAKEARVARIALGEQLDACHAYLELQQTQLVAMKARMDALEAKLKALLAR